MSAAEPSPSRSPRSKGPETATYVLEPRHRDLIRTAAFNCGLYQWAWLSEVIVRGCPTITQPIPRTRSLGPSQRPTLIHYTVNLSTDARDLLNSTADAFANGDRSFLLRVVLDAHAAS